MDDASFDLVLLATLARDQDDISGPRQLTAVLIASLRSAMLSDFRVSVGGMPRSICRMISAGSSDLGLSLVRMTWSLNSQAILAITGRFAASRSPPSDDRNDAPLSAMTS